MPRVIDLSLPIADHFRWPVERRVKGDVAKGDTYQITWAGWTVHGFTHIDAPRHMVADGATSSAFNLDDLVGAAAVVDLTAVGDNSPIDVAHLEATGQHIMPADRVLLKTGWDERRSYHTPEFWTEAPYMTRPACEWLLERRIKVIGYDFPQDQPIRNFVTGEAAPGIAEFVTHDVLLRNGVIMVEYLCNLGSLAGERVMLAALPLKIPDADGCPARVIAWDI